ncbi:MAG: sigma-70 family RNA polymerase sigma factor [Bacteroidota bacterium]
MQQKKTEFLREIDAHKGLIISLCQAYFEGDEDRRDAFQDVVLSLWKAYDTFENRSKISTWIYSIALRTLLKKVRNEKRSVASTQIEAVHNQIVGANADDYQGLLHQMLSSLDSLARAIFILHLEGYGNKEIANILSLSPSNISTKLSRIKKQLRGKINLENYINE